MISKRKTKSDRIKVIPFIPKQDLHPSDTCLDHNKALSDISDTELYSLIIKVYKPPKIFDFPETEHFFRFVSGFKSFHGFVILGGRTAPIAFLVLYLAIKLWEVLVWKTYRENLIEHGLRQLKHPKKMKILLRGHTKTKYFLLDL